MNETEDAARQRAIAVARESIATQECRQSCQWPTDFSSLSASENTKAVRGARRTMCHRCATTGKGEYKLPSLYAPTYDELWWSSIGERLAAYKQRMAGLRALFGEMVQASAALTARSGCT